MLSIGVSTEWNRTSCAGADRVLVVAERTQSGQDEVVEPRGRGGMVGRDNRTPASDPIASGKCARTYRLRLPDDARPPRGRRTTGTRPLRAASCGWHGSKLHLSALRLAALLQHEAEALSLGDVESVKNRRSSPSAMSRTSEGGVRECGSSSTTASIPRRSRASPSRAESQSSQGSTYRTEVMSQPVQDLRNGGRVGQLGLPRRSGPSPAACGGLRANRFIVARWRTSFCRWNR